MRYGTARREVALLSGRAFFEVVLAADRPFVVAVDDATVTVTGTAFDVRSSAQTTSVAVQSGTVEVALDHGRRRAATLTRGERLDIDRKSDRIARSDIPPDDVATWRQHRLVVDKATVAEVVDELRRHYSGVVLLRDGALADRLVSGIFDLRHPVEALQAAVRTHDGSVTRITPYVVVISGRSSGPPLPAAHDMSAQDARVRKTMRQFRYGPLNSGIGPSLSHVRGRRSMRTHCGELAVTSIVARPLAVIALAGAVSAGVPALPAAAQDKMTSEPSPLLEAQRDQAAAFDIPAQPLAQALTAFGRQSGLQVAFDPAATAGKASAAVSGSMTAEQALRQLLAGSGLSYQFTSARAVTVSGVAGSTGAVQLDPVLRAGPATGAAAGRARQPAAGLRRRAGGEGRCRSAF